MLPLINYLFPDIYPSIRLFSTNRAEAEVNQMLLNLHKGKSIGERTLFRQIRSIIVLLVITSSYWLVRRNWLSISYILTVLCALQLLIDYQRPKKILADPKMRLQDYALILIFNIILAGTFLITGSSQSPLLIILLIPIILFGAEFGTIVGAWNYLGVILFVILILVVTRTSISLNILTNSISFIVVAGACLATIGIFHRSHKHYQRKTEYLLIHDELTGLYNRRFLKSVVLKEIKAEHKFGLVLFDINYFKYYNDYWGHSAGDILLISIGKVIQKSVRPQDIVIRHSGDEFVVLIPEANQAMVESVIDNILQSIDSYNFPGEECFPCNKLSISYGFSIFPDDAHNYQNLFTTADQALYNYKKERFH